MRTVSGGVSGNRHAEIVGVPQRLKPLAFLKLCGTAEAVPLSAGRLWLGLQSRCGLDCCLAVAWIAVDWKHVEGAW